MASSGLAIESMTPPQAVVVTREPTMSPTSEPTEAGEVGVDTVSDTSDSGSMMIIIALGAVIAILLGAVVFLYCKKQSNKGENLDRDVEFAEMRRKLTLQENQLKTMADEMLKRTSGGPKRAPETPKGGMTHQLTVMDVPSDMEMTTWGAPPESGMYAMHEGGETLHNSDT